MLVHDCARCKTDCHESYKKRYLHGAKLLSWHVHVMTEVAPDSLLMTLVKLDCLEFEKAESGTNEYINLNDALAREAAK